MATVTVTVIVTVVGSMPAQHVGVVGSSSEHFNRFRGSDPSNPLHKTGGNGRDEVMGGNG